MEYSAIRALLRASPSIEESALSPSPSISFVELWAAIARGASAVLASSLPHQPEASVLNDLRENLTLRLSQVGEGAVWEHFNARRTLDDLVKAHLDADDRGCRRTIYCRVIEALRADGLQELTNQYPVLRRHLCATVASWLTSNQKLLLNIQSDHRMLSERFDLPADARLTGVKTGMSDPHRGGLSVAILTFASASAGQTSVVYKPRDVRIEAAYHQLLSDLSAKTPNVTPLRSLAVLPRDGYGYVEYIAHEICSNDAELAEFYGNAGRLTAILYILGCNDCHYENVIAHRGQLILVDAETLLQSVPHRAVIGPGSATAGISLEARLGDSVMRIGLLPHWFFIAGERIPRDLSALGINPPAAEHETYKGWSALNTDGMFTGAAMRRALLPTSSPVGVGSANRFSDFTADFHTAFRQQLEIIAEDRDAWLCAGGYLERFRDLRGRFIRRPTWIYLWIRGKLLEPDALRGEAAQDEALTRLSAPRRTDIDDRAAVVLTAERVQLNNLDVPLFEHLVAGRDLILDEAVFALDFFAESGLDAARRRIEALDSGEIELQIALVRGLVAAKARRVHRAPPRDASMTRLAGGAPSNEERLAAAIAIGNLLVDSSIADGSGRVEWLGIESAADIERSCFGPIGQTLYSGRLGIAIFLATLADAVSAKQACIYRQAASSACADLVYCLEATDALADKRIWWRDQPLGLAGSGGQLLAASLLSSLLPEMDRAMAHGLAALLDALDPEMIRCDDGLDIMFGCSGLIGSLLRIRTPKAFDLARMAGDRLVERQDREGGWIIPALGARALTGFSHGASGGAAALAKLAATTNHQPYFEAATRALKYERAQYDRREKNWPDYRASSASLDSPFMLSWCHGAPGIALARLCVKRTPLWDKENAEDVELALAATTDAARLDDSLCCGSLGRAAILRAAHDCGGESRWLKAAGQLERQALSRMRGEGGHIGYDVLGMFQGAAGVGLELLDGLPHTTGARAPQVLSAGLLD